MIHEGVDQVLLPKQKHDEWFEKAKQNQEAWQQRLDKPVSSKKNCGLVGVVQNWSSMATSKPLCILTVGYQMN
eukprot:15347437-Ditylum_brightwellii.AAC.1